jgi:hypothetical protein
MLGKPDSGTRVDRVMLGAASNSIPPARSCDSISGSPPSWLLAKTVTLIRPAAVSVELRYRQGTRKMPGHADETILGNPRNRPETNGG